MLSRGISLVSKPIDGVARRFMSQKPSMISQILFDTPSQNPLNEEFPGVPSNASNKATAPKAAQVSKLSNGITVVSRDDNGATASVGLYVKAGSRYDVLPGTSHVVEHLGFATTEGRSTQKIQRDVEDMGAVVSTKTSRESIVYSGEVLRNSAEELTALIAEVTTQPKLWYWEVDEQKHVLEGLIEKQSTDPVSAIVEGVHSAAFGSTSPLGHSVYASKEDLEGVTADTIRHFLGAQFTGSNMVVSGVNITHEDLKAVAESSFGNVAATTAVSSPKTTYLGGESLVRGSKAGVAHVALAFSAPGLNSNQLHTVGILQALLGGSSAHSAVTRQSRIARSLHNDAHSFIRSMTAFAFPYTDAGIVGIAGTSADHESGRLVDTAIGFLKDVASGNITAQELERAKKAYLLSYLLEVENRAGGRDELGSSILLTGKYTPVADVIKAVNAVTAADVQSVTKTALASAPSISAIGSLSTIPRYDVLANLLK